MSFDRNAAEFVAGVLTGLVMGSVATLLLVPRSGREIRERLGRDAKRMAVRVSGLHPAEWDDIAAEENVRNLVENLDGIRAAGL